MQYMEFASSAKEGGKEGKKRLKCYSSATKNYSTPCSNCQDYKQTNKQTFAILQLMPGNTFCDATVMNKRICDNSQTISLPVTYKNKLANITDHIHQYHVGNYVQLTS